MPLGEETMPMGQVVEAIQALESSQERKMRDMLMQFEQTMNAREAAWQQALKDDFDRLFKVRDNHYEGKIKALRERLLALEAPLAESLRLSTQVAGHEKALLEHANCIVEIGRELCNIDSACPSVLHELLKKLRSLSVRIYYHIEHSTPSSHLQDKSASRDN